MHILFVFMTVGLFAHRPNVFIHFHFGSSFVFDIGGLMAYFFAKLGIYFFVIILFSYNQVCLLLFSGTIYVRCFKLGGLLVGTSHLLVSHVGQACKGLGWYAPWTSDIHSCTDTPRTLSRGIKAPMGGTVRWSNAFLFKFLITDKFLKTSQSPPPSPGGMGSPATKHWYGLDALADPPHPPPPLQPLLSPSHGTGLWFRASGAQPAGLADPPLSLNSKRL